jgi:hypothetical protein
MCDTRDGDEYDDATEEYREWIEWPAGWEFNWYDAILENRDKDFTTLPSVAWPAAEEILSEEFDHWWKWMETREAAALTLGDKAEEWLASDQT